MTQLSIKLLIFAILITVSTTQVANAGQVAQCLGAWVIDNSPVTAKIYLDESKGRIELETSVGNFQSVAQVETSSEMTVTVGNNDFQMNFSVAYEKPASLVQAFLQGQFFVEDFYCIRTN